MEKKCTVGNKKSDVFLYRKGDKLHFINIVTMESIEVPINDKKRIMELIKGNSENKVNNIELMPNAEDNEKIQSITIVTSYKCNYQCEYCYEQNEKTKIDCMSPFLVEKVRDFYQAFFPANETKVFSDTINVIGGETLLLENRPIIEKIIDVFEFNHLVITTNGTFLSEYIDLFAPIKSKLLLKVSIDGTEEMHYSRRHTKDKNAYKKALYGIQKALNNGIKVLVISVFNPQFSVYEYCLFFNQMEEYGWLKNELLSLAFLPEMNSNMDDISNESVNENIEAYIELLKSDKRACFVLADKLFPGMSNFKKAKALAEKGSYTRYRCECLYGPNYSFLPDGKIKFCMAAKGEEGIIGEYYPIPRINEKMITLLRERTNDKGKCKDCSFINFCKGGCPVNSVNSGLGATEHVCGVWNTPTFLKYGECFL